MCPYHVTNTGKSVRKGLKMTYKMERLMKQVALENDLVFIGIHSRSRRDWVSFKNQKGVILLHPIDRHERESVRGLLNLKGHIKRFAKGQVHGLRIVPP